VQFTSAKHNISIKDHPEASQLPRSNGSLLVTPAVENFRSLVRSPTPATTLEDWIYSDIPQLQLHIVSFTDATIVTLSWLHTLLDAMGRNVILRSWQAMLEGREQDVPEFWGYDFDPLATLGAPESEKLQDENAEEEEEYILKPKAIKGWNMFKFIFNFAWELIVYKKDTMHQVCIPPAFYKRLREQAMNDLKDVPPNTIVMNTSDPKNPQPFLSDGDILAAWWTRMIMSCQPWNTPANANKTITLFNVFGMRNLLENTEPRLLPKGKAYIANCVTAIQSYFTLSELLSLPLGITAARVRKDLVAQSTRAQVNAGMRLYKAKVEETGHPPLYGESNMVISAFSNWTKGKMYETDFSAAIIKEGKVPHTRGKPSYIQADGNVVNFSVRNSGPCIGKDTEGNYWIGTTLRVKTWENLIKALENIA
jgi:hypothetical protein